MENDTFNKILTKSLYIIQTEEGLLESFSLLVTRSEKIIEDEKKSVHGAVVGILSSVVADKQIHGYELLLQEPVMPHEKYPNLFFALASAISELLQDTYNETKEFLITTLKKPEIFEVEKFLKEFNAFLTEHLSPDISLQHSEKGNHEFLVLERRTSE